MAFRDFWCKLDDISVLRQLSSQTTSRSFTTVFTIIVVCNTVIDIYGSQGCSV